MANIKINRQRCKGCLLCIAQCPRDLIQLGNSLNKLGIHPAVPKKDINNNCTGCGFCALICPDTCIEVYK